MKKNIFYNQGLIKIDENDNNYELDIKSISEGLSSFDDFFIFKNQGAIKIFNRNCDHANGKLIIKKNDVSCPLHGWCFDPLNSKYKNNSVKKEPIKFETGENDKIHFRIKKKTPSLPNFKISKKISVEFVSHAFIFIESEDFRFAMDPWATGPSFIGGWWLNNPPTKFWKKKLNACNFIYISHNHPDHLNRHTLKFIRQDMVFIIPDFISKSVEKILINMGFKNLVKLKFQSYYKFDDTDLFITILKSGDFRDDSGLYFTYGDFSLFSAVDANNINYNEFPKDSTLFLSSFSGGASGYPLCHDQYSIAEKISMVEKKKKSMMSIVKKNVKSINSKYFMPYAGFFDERAKRDSFIKENNKKISIDDYEKALKKQSILNVSNKNKFTFNGNQLISSQKLETDGKIDNPEKWININLKKQKTSNQDIISYFKNSKFYSKLILFLVLTDDSFSEEIKSFRIDFSYDIPKVIEDNKDSFEKYNSNQKNILLIKAREHSFYYMINNRIPWENLSIGFQCRINRKPDVYNEKFWFHFTNIYF